MTACASLARCVLSASLQHRCYCILLLCSITGATFFFFGTSSLPHASSSQVYNMWAGNIFGNSPASIVCLHEMSWFSQIASAFDSPPGPDSVPTPRHPHVIQTPFIDLCPWVCLSVYDIYISRSRCTPRWPRSCGCSRSTLCNRMVSCFRGGTNGRTYSGECDWNIMI